jgi:cold shock CspA family protein
MRGFGFIARDDGAQDVLCHYSAVLVDGCFRKLGEGHRVDFDTVDSPEGPVAINVRRVFDAKGVLVTVLCGDAVQIRTRSWGKPNLRAAAERLRAFGQVHLAAVLVRLRAPPHEMTLFDDGRAIVKGTNDPAVARALLAEWLGIRLPEAEESPGSPGAEGRVP